MIDVLGLLHLEELVEIVFIYNGTSTHNQALGNQVVMPYNTDVDSKGFHLRSKSSLSWYN